MRRAARSAQRTRERSASRRHGSVPGDASVAICPADAAPTPGATRMNLNDRLPSESERRRPNHGVRSGSANAKRLAQTHSRFTGGGIRGKRGATASGLERLFGGLNVLESAVLTATPLGEQTAHLKTVNCTVCDFSLSTQLLQKMQLGQS